MTTLNRLLLGTWLVVVSSFPLPASRFAQAIEQGAAPPPVVHLSRTPHELRRRHGERPREEVEAWVGRVLRYFRAYLKIPLIRGWLVNGWLDSAWGQAKPFIPPEYLEELRGLADGAGVPLRQLYRLHAIPDRTYSCANFAAWGRATAGGRLIPP